MRDASTRSALVAALPATAAVFVFGVIYGGVAGPVMGSLEAMLGSLLIFSGSVQFTIVALLQSGAGPLAVVAGAAALNLRNLVLGAVIRPRLEGSAMRRGALGWFLTDEAAGLALASRGDASRILLTSGLLLYSAWQIGTAVGLAGASIDALSDAASAVFPRLVRGIRRGRVHVVVCRCSGCCRGRRGRACIVGGLGLGSHRCGGGRDSGGEPGERFVSIWLIIGVALLTYGSRALALVAMPEPPARLKAILDRVPAPLFAGLAAASLFDEGDLVDERTLVATLGALLLTPTRSLLGVLVGGLAAYGIAELIW